MPPSPHRQNWRARFAGALAARDRSYRERRAVWRFLVPGVLALAGVLFVTSAVSSGGTDLRAGRYDDLDGLANAERSQLEGLRAQAADLSREVNRISLAKTSRMASAERRRLDALRGPSGLLAVSGPAVTVTLNDAPQTMQENLPSGIDVNELLVHQQDIQAVANAMWAGGAEAMTIQGQRVVSTTGIKCVGNTVVLHDVPYSPPYVISAIGPVDSIVNSLDTDRYIDIYLQFVDRFKLGWDLKVDPKMAMPAYNGSVDLSYAHSSPAPGASSPAH